MLARDVMRRQVVSVEPSRRLGDVAEVLAGNRISGVPVVDGDGRLLGMIAVENMVCAEDGRRRHWRQILADPSLLLHQEASAGEIMSRDVLTVEETTPLSTLIRLLAKRPIKRVPVVKEGRLVGIVSRIDVLQALSAGL
jgi:CBS domain-containing protein